MRLLLDTCTFVWIAADSRRLSRRARELFQDPANNVFLSAASAWELAVKHSLHAIDLPEPPGRFVPRYRSRHAIEPLDLNEEMALHVGTLPKLHRDPFDRILICQAIVAEMTILTPDELIRQYPIRTIW